MDVHLHAGDAAGRISALYRRLREAIVVGRLRSGELANVVVLLGTVLVTRPTPAQRRRLMAA